MTQAPLRMAAADGRVIRVDDIAPALFTPLPQTPGSPEELAHEAVAPHIIAPSQPTS